jgi:hypothetical protein
MNRDKIIVGVIALVLIVGFAVVGVKAAQTYGAVSINNVENLTMNVEGAEVDGEMFGASGTRFPSGISADSTSPNAGEVRATDLKSTDDVILTAAAFCIDFHATSTDTQLSMTASSTATIEGVDGVMMFNYGSCQ